MKLLFIILLLGMVGFAISKFTIKEPTLGDLLNASRGERDQYLDVFKRHEEEEQQRQQRKDSWCRTDSKFTTFTLENQMEK